MENDKLEVRIGHFYSTRSGEWVHIKQGFDVPVLGVFFMGECINLPDKKMGVWRTDGRASAGDGVVADEPLDLVSEVRPA